MTPSKILYIHHGQGWGGAPKSLNLLLKNLDRALFEPWVLCLFGGEAADVFSKTVGADHVIVDERLTFTAHTNQAWFPFYHPSTLRYLYQIATMSRTTRLVSDHLQKIKPSLVHLNSTCLVAAGMAVKNEKIPLVWHLREPLSHGTFGVRYKKFKNWIESLSDTMIGISKNDAAPFLQSPKCEVIYNPVEAPVGKSRSQIRKEIGVDPTDKLIALFGYSPDKGIFDFVKAAALVVKKDAKAKFLFMGFRKNAPAKWIEEARELIKQNNLDDKFVFKGENGVGEFNSSPEIYMGAADVIAVPHTIPHFSRIVLEAGIVGTPVVAYAWGGAEELIEEGKTGKLVEPLNVARLSDALLDVISDEEKRLEMSRLALRKAFAEFSAAAHAVKVQKIYQKILLKIGR